MNRSPVVLFALWALTLLFLAGCGPGDPARTANGDGETLPYYAEATFTPHWYAASDEVPTSFHAIRPFSLTDQLGRNVTERNFEGRIYIANFFFTSCPGICPMTMANMARLQAAFSGRERVALLSHSVTPEADSVPALLAFAERMEALSTQWYLVTGDRADVYDLGKNYYFADEDLGEPADLRSGMGEDTFLHTESFFLIDQDRHVRGVYNGMNSAAVTQLIADVEVLLGGDTT